MLALAMGLQNARGRAHGIPDLATNVMTVTFTAIAAESRPAGVGNRNWRRRGLPVCLLVAGAGAGAFLLRFGTVWPLVATGRLVSVAMWPLLLGKPRAGMA
jgi:uncharacterized membrane protein YoaK (UPF0700 family)